MAGPPIGPFTWCPGDPLKHFVVKYLTWDWSVCHTYNVVGPGPNGPQGNVFETFPSGNSQPSSIWEGPNPPDSVCAGPITFC